MNKSNWKQRLQFLIVGLAWVAAINWLVLYLFGQHSPYRSEHSLFGITLLVIYSSVWLDETVLKVKPLEFFLVALVPGYLGTVFPDLDITFLGIGGHRNPLFHSSLPYFVLFLFLGIKKFDIRVAIVGFGIGLASHLFLDSLDRAAIRWLPGGLFVDRIWLIGNGLLCFIPPGMSQKKLSC